MKFQLKSRMNGFSLLELMVAMTIATFMSLTVLSIYIGQTTQLSSENQRNSAAQEANRTFNLVSRLLRQAHKTSVNISYPRSNQINGENVPEITDDAIKIDFTLPSGFNIWPNDKAPYTNNNVQLTWDNDNDGNKPYIIRIANTVDGNTIANDDLSDLSGSNSGNRPRIINLDIWPLADQRNLQNSVNKTANNGYLLRVTARTANSDISYTNPNIAIDNPLRHYRTYTVSGIISPRN